MTNLFRPKPPYGLLKSINEGFALTIGYGRGYSAGSASGVSEVQPVVVRRRGGWLPGAQVRIRQPVRGVVVRRIGLHEACSYRRSSAATGGPINRSVRAVWRIGFDRDIRATGISVVMKEARSMR